MIDLTSISNVLSAELNKSALKKIIVNPTTPILLIESLNVSETKKWIESRHSQEFGRFAANNDEAREKAAEWFIEKIREFYTYRANLSQTN